MKATITATASLGARFARARMSDTCSIVRKLPRQFNDATGVYDEPEQPVWSGPCEFLMQAANGQPTESGTRDLVASAPELRIPVEVTAAIRSGDVVRVTTALGEIAGVIVAEEIRTHRTARRFEVEVSQ